MLIVDSQVHIWGADTPERPWPKRAEPQRPVPLGKDDLLREMDAAGVDRVIIVPPSWEGDRNDLAIEAHVAHPIRFATMGRLDPEDASSRPRIATWRTQPGMLGLRFTFHIPPLVRLLTEGHMASALPCYSTDTYPYKSLYPYIRRAYDAFGPRRLFWGTDLSRSPITYSQHVTMFTEEMPWLTSEDKQWIMGRGVCEWLGWEVQ